MKLEYHIVLPYITPFVRNLYKLKSLTPYTNDLTQCIRVSGSNTHKNSIRSNNTPMSQEKSARNKSAESQLKDALKYLSNETTPWS
jgi:hypothetical protein